MSKAKRHETIRDLLKRNSVSNQSQLLALLTTEDIETTQATLSRDLRELGVVKENDTYLLPPASDRPRIGLNPITERLRENLSRVDRSGTLVILHLKERNAPQHAELIEGANFTQAVGVVGSGSTIFIATRSIGEASNLASQLRPLIDR